MICANVPATLREEGLWERSGTTAKNVGNLQNTITSTITKYLQRATKRSVNTVKKNYILTYRFVPYACTLCMTCADIKYKYTYHTAKTAYQKFEIYIPRNETARPQSHFLHSCYVSVSDLYIPTIGQPILLQENRCSGPIVGIYKSQIYKCWNWDWGRAVSFLGVIKSNFLCSALYRMVYVFIPIANKLVNLLKQN
jgi:hypothetical protein